ncbi:hypothetical protein Lal_00024714 [Lupinus albus]|nr:hypothetical protein Lal_00024714 [Lupinus albus]
MLSGFTHKMKSGFSSGWPSVVRLRLKDKSATPFCIFSKVKSASNNPRSAPVYLNVYDLTTVNSYMYWAGLGIFHSAVEVYGIEYAFGAHDYPTTGVFEVEPRQCPGFKFRKSIFMGTTTLDPLQMRDFMERQSANYNGDTYHLIAKNCNHFCEDICFKLTGSSIPKWVNRLARIAFLVHRKFGSRITLDMLHSMVPYATAYCLMPLKLPMLNMIPASKSVTTKNEDYDPRSVAYHQSRCPRGKYRCLRYFFTLTIKVVYHPGS